MATSDTLHDAPPSKRRTASGLGLALTSALSFGVSGPFASSLLDLGWTPSSAVLVRIGGTALVLWLVVAATQRDFWAALRAGASSVLLCGTFAIAGVQICYFSAVEHLPVSVALLLEYLAPTLVVAWAWLVRGHRPSAMTLVGGTAALVGMGFVVDIFSGAEFAWTGLLWGLGSAVCQACYFLVADRVDNQMNPTLFAASSTAVGTVVVGLLGLTGALSMSFPTGEGVAPIGGTEVHWLVPVLVLILVCGVSAYVTGIKAIPRLGAARSSLVALSEVLFAALAAWLLLSQVPTGWQIVGGVLILVGILVSRFGDGDGDRPAPQATATATDTGTGTGTGTEDDAEETDLRPAAEADGVLNGHKADW
jgi:drug/metabolite transporter (DMT)-like permease